MPLRLQSSLLAAAFALGAALAFAVPAAAYQATDLVTVKSVRVGFAGRCKSGFWAPIWLDLVAGPAPVRGNLEIVIADGDSVPVIFSQGPPGMLDVPAGQQRTVLCHAKIGPEAAPIRAQLRANEQIIWSQELSGFPAPLAATQRLAVGIGPDLDLAGAAATIRRSSEHSLAVVQTKSSAELPDRWWGYEGVDVAVLASSDAQFLASLSPDQRGALIQWVRLGGRLVLCAGQRGAELAAEGGPWAALLPGKLVEVSPLRERAGLETFAGVELPWEGEDFQLRRPEVTRLAQIDGTVLVDEIGGGSTRPLIVRSAHGFGEVVFIGLDLDHPGLAKWAGRPRLLGSLISGARGRKEDDDTEVRRGVAHLGYDDLVGQLRAALDQFPGVTLVNFTTVSVLTLVYLLLIGPGDYLLLSRLNIPRHITWLTFSLVAVGFAGAAWYLGNEAHGDRVRLNQVEVVDLDVSRGVVRGTAWTHLYSPRTARFTATLRINSDRIPVTSLGGMTAWQGLPGDSLGGLASRQTALTTVDAYLVVPPGADSGFNDLPLQSAASKSISSRWWGQNASPIVSSLRRNDYGSLEGTLVNPLPVELTECLVAFEERLYRLGKLGPGQVVEMKNLSPLHLEARLTERTIAGSKDIATQWEQDSTDLPRIVRMLMFHQAARGRSYTRLGHRYQSYLDLSDHLHLGRAVLAGRAAQPVAELALSGPSPAGRSEQTSLTWCRVVFPVQASEPAASQP